MIAPRQNILAVIAVVLGAIGLSLSAYTFRQIAESENIHRTRAETLHQLCGLRDRATNDRAALALMESMAAHGPPDFEAAAGKILPDIKPVIEELNAEPLTGGWSRKQITIAFDNASLSDTGRLVEYVENQRPPWRLIACEFSAAAAGRGPVKLTFETIAR